MENQPELLKQVSQRNLNVRFTFDPNSFQQHHQEASVRKNHVSNHFTEASQEQIIQNSNFKIPLSQEGCDQILLHLLDLQSKWIQKQTQIKDYVENLKKTVEQRDLKIEKLQIENYKLSTQLTQMAKQKNDIFQKLNQIHGAMISLQNKKHQVDSDRKSSQKTDQSHQNQMIAQILKLTKQKDSNNLHFLPPQQKFSERNSEKEGCEEDSKSMEKRILSNMIKLFQENFQICSSGLGSEQSSQINSENRFAKKGREIRGTLTTNDTLSTNPRDLRGSFTHKEVSSPIDSQKNNASNEAKKKLNYYKSARTITFSKDEEVDDQVLSDKEKIYSHNIIQFDQKLYSENETSQHKESERSNCKKQSEPMERELYHKKGSQSKCLRIESKALSQSHENVHAAKQKRKNKERKKSSNLDYSLSSSLVSASQTNEMYSSKMQDEEQRESLRPLSHENEEEKTNFNGLSKLSAASFNMKKSKIFQNQDSLRPNFEKRGNGSSRAQSKFSEQELQNQWPVEQYQVNSSLNSLQKKSEKSNQKSKFSNPEASPSVKRNQLFVNTAFTFQNTPQNYSSSAQNTAQKPSVNTLKKSMTLQRPSSVALDQTHMKRSLFEPNQFDAFETQTKNQQSQNNKISSLPIPNDKNNLFPGKVGPQTKCSTFLEKSYGNSFYCNKSNSSDDPFKRLKMHQEISESEQGKKSSKMNFENETLKSYNKVLQKQSKKMSQTEKLMEKFTSQNVSILNKIHKKSIF